MANTRGALMLYDNGNLVQKISLAGGRETARRAGPLPQKRSVDPRPLMVGQSRFSPAVFRNVSVTAFVSPDCSDGLFAYVVNNATNEILLNVYEFSSPVMGVALIAAHSPGADVQVLVEGGPVGGIGADEKDALWKMNRSGIRFYAMVSSKDVHAPYRYDHGKYAVIDRRALLLTSENFRDSGFAETGTTGNRGWGVYLEDPALAGYFSTVFLTDTKSPSVVPYNGAPGNPESPSTGKYVAEFAPRTFDKAVVIPVLAPDTSSQIADLINSAGESIEIEETYITNETPFSLNPYLSAAINASRRGVRVRVLLDSYWYNIDGLNDNDEIVALINHIGVTEHIPLEARCAILIQTGSNKFTIKG